MDKKQNTFKTLTNSYIDALMKQKKQKLTVYMVFLFFFIIFLFFFFCFFIIVIKLSPFEMPFHIKKGFVFHKGFQTL